MSRVPELVMLPSARLWFLVMRGQGLRLLRREFRMARRPCVLRLQRTTVGAECAFKRLATVVAW